jgi:ribosomal protein S12 methylthiotransferase
VKTFYIRTLGCNKNTVDSEILMTLLRERGYRRVDRPEEAERIIVNTCAFIDEAKEEAIDTIFSLNRLKGTDSRLIVTGCLPQLYADEINREMPEVDAVAGSGNLRSVVDAIDSKSSRRDFPETREIPDTYSWSVQRTELQTSGGFAYLKISEGCSRSCSFCLIPRIRGGMRSRPEEEIVREARYLETRGIKELILTSQDTLGYGVERGERNGLSELLKRLTGETGIPRIRLLYLRPGSKLIRDLAMFDDERIAKYFDIPLQHVSRSILQSMNREGDSALFERVVGEIRNRYPQAVLRTTLITGFPGETGDHFDELLEFVGRVRFNHLGVFVFSPQPGTRAYGLKNRVGSRIAERRRELLLDTQRGISRAHLEREIGKSYQVLIEERLGNGDIYFGRSYHFAPEVDGSFMVRSREKTLYPGIFVRAEVSNADDYDLHGFVVE